MNLMKYFIIPPPTSVTLCSNILNCSASSVSLMPCCVQGTHSHCESESERERESERDFPEASVRNWKAQLRQRSSFLLSPSPFHILLSPWVCTSVLPDAVLVLKVRNSDLNTQFDIGCHIRLHLNYPFGAGIISLILAHPVYKMWIIQEPNKLALWNKLHFKEKKRRV